MGLSRLTLDNGVSYDLAAMFTPRKVGQKYAWQAFWQNLKGWKKALRFHSRVALSVSGARWLGYWFSRVTAFRC